MHGEQIKDRIIGLHAKNQKLVCSDIPTTDGWFSVWYIYRQVLHEDAPLQTTTTEL